LNRKAWDGDALSRWGELNPPLGKLAIGASLRAGGATHWFGLYDFTRSSAENAAAGLVPPPAVLLPARVGMACFGAASCVLLFLIGRALAGLWCGALALVFLLSNELFTTLSSQAMIDIPFVTFLLATCLLALRLVAAKPEHSLRFALLGGLFAGLAALVKIHGLPIGMGLLAVALAVRGAQLGSRRRALLLGVAAFAVALRVSYAGAPTIAAAASARTGRISSALNALAGGRVVLYSICSSEAMQRVALPRPLC
jgi:4-amino-4-deoxy-L-arabinose transferase-like glycosyltransferase